VAEVPLLIETGALDLYDKIVVVDCNYQNRLQRFIAKGGGAKEQFDARERYQTDLSDKIKYADYVVDNNGSEQESLSQVIRIWNKIIMNQT